MRLRLFQYWDSPNPPNEVQELMATWANDTSFEYHRYNHNEAQDVIHQYHNERTLRAFLSCNIPAMQADFFRLCALYIWGGIYVDADIRNNGGVDTLVNKARRGFLFIRHGNIANDFMVVRSPHDPLISYALRVATENIEARKPSSVWAVTGPGILTSLYNSHGREKNDVFDGFFIDDVKNIRSIVGFRWDLDYKKSENHWVGRTDLYRDPTTLSG